MAYEHAKSHLFPPHATKTASRFVGGVCTLNVNQHCIRLIDLPDIKEHPVFLLLCQLLVGLND